MGRTPARKRVHGNDEAARVARHLPHRQRWVKGALHEPARVAVQPTLLAHLNGVGMAVRRRGGEVGRNRKGRRKGGREEESVLVSASVRWVCVGWALAHLQVGVLAPSRDYRQVHQLASGRNKLVDRMTDNYLAELNGTPMQVKGARLILLGWWEETSLFKKQKQKQNLKSHELLIVIQVGCRQWVT